MINERHTTRIRNAERVIAWDAERGDHCYRSDCDVVFDESGIVSVGDAGASADAGAHARAGTVVDGTGIMVMPGMISTHAHLNGGSLATGFLEEVLDPRFRHSPMYTRKGPFWKSDVDTPGRDGGRWFRAAMRHALAELMASGVTTVVDIQGVSEHGDRWCDVLDGSGMRAWVAPSFQEAVWRVRDGRVLDHEWDAGHGRRGFEQACATLDTVRAHPSGRLRGMMFPAQVDTVGEGLMRESRAEARARGLVFQTHCAQSVPEFQAMVARTGVTPVRWLADLGVLDESTILGHAIYLDHHSALAWHGREDLSILAERRASVAHCPITFSRWGTSMEDFARYRDAGVRLSMGNDTGPHNMIEEIRCAFTLGRIRSHAPAALSMSDVFRAATTGGARALGRDDIGRIAPGARADLVLVDLTHPGMRPGIDPLRSLVFTAADRAVRDVYVDGRRIYADHRPTGFDAAAASAELTEALATKIAEISGLDDVPPMDEIATVSFPETSARMR